MASQLCSEVNGGGCKNKVSARNGYICAAGHSGNGVARPTIPISKMSQNEKLELARNTEDKTLQVELFRTGDSSVQKYLATNLLISEDLQLELFHTGDFSVQWHLGHASSIGRDLAIELAKAGQVPSGYTQNKSLAELLKPENLSLIKQYPETFSRAYLYRLFLHPQEDKEESKALALHGYLAYEKNGGRHAVAYKDMILERYAGDQEVALILNAEPA